MRWLRLIRLLPQLSDAAEQLQVKGWYLSKTIWTNLVVTAAAVAVAVGGARFDVPPDTSAALAGGIVAVVNIVLRALTNKPVGLRSVPGPAGSGHNESVSDRGDLGI